MSDVNTDAPAGGEAQGQPTAPGMKILAQYIKDLSFENAVVERV